MLLPSRRAVKEGAWGPGGGFHAGPQLHGMYAGDRSRKEALVEYGFRLPSAFDNRPLTFEEFRS